MLYNFSGFTKNDVNLVKIKYFDFTFPKSLFVILLRLVSKKKKIVHNVIQLKASGLPKHVWLFNGQTPRIEWVKNVLKLLNFLVGKLPVISKVCFQKALYFIMTFFSFETFNLNSFFAFSYALTLIWDPTQQTQRRCYNVVTTLSDW